MVWIPCQLWYGSRVNDDMNANHDMDANDDMDSLTAIASNEIEQLFHLTPLIYLTLLELNICLECVGVVIIPPKVMELHRPLNCQSCWFPCCLQVIILTDILSPMAEYMLHWSPQNMRRCNFHGNMLCPQYMGCILVPMVHLQELEVVIEDIHAGKVFIFTFQMMKLRKLFWKHHCTLCEGGAAMEPNKTSVHDRGCGELNHFLRRYLETKAI